MHYWGFVCLFSSITCYTYSHKLPLQGLSSNQKSIRAQVSCSTQNHRWCEKQSTCVHNKNVIYLCIKGSTMQVLDQPQQLPSGKTIATWPLQRCQRNQVPSLIYNLFGISHYCNNYFVMISTCFPVHFIHL